MSARPVDVSSRESVRALAQAAAGLGPVVNVVHTAGLSPVQAPPAAILAVDLVGIALVFEEFGAVIARGGAGLVISSMAGHMPPPLDLETARLLGLTPADDLLALPALSRAGSADSSGAAYAISKQANHARAQAAAVTWGQRGARVNSISPGIVLTPLAKRRDVRPRRRGLPEDDHRLRRRPGRAPPTRSPPPRPSSSAPTPASSPGPTCSSTAASSPPSGPAVSNSNI